MSLRLLLVLAGGALGSSARYAVAIWSAGRWGAAFPWGTLIVNVAGSFLIWLIANLADEAGSIGSDGRVFLVVGILGGFTTFSSFSLETLRLIEDRQPMTALWNILGNVLLAFTAVSLGFAAGRALER